MEKDRREQRRFRVPDVETAFDESERRQLDAIEAAVEERLSGKRLSQVTVTSFTRIAQTAFKLYGGGAGTYADECAKTVLMAQAAAEAARLAVVPSGMVLPCAASCAAGGVAGVDASTQHQLVRYGRPIL